MTRNTPDTSGSHTHGALTTPVPHGLGNTLEPTEPLERDNALCRAGRLPDRYARNQSLTPAEQALVLEGRVLVVGLGGLGGHVIDTLARLGVGHLTGADGDVFEASNLNRQLLCTEERLGRPKAEAACEHVHSVNSSLDFQVMPCFLQGKTLKAAVRDKDVIVDALGGLAERLALHRAAAEAGVPLVSAGVAGFTGWVAVVHPGEDGPARFMGDGPGVEDRLGVLAPTVALAAALQCTQVLNILIGRPTAQGLLYFDLAEQGFTSLEWGKKKT